MIRIRFCLELSIGAMKRARCDAGIKIYNRNVRDLQILEGLFCVVQLANSGHMSFPNPSICHLIMEKCIVREREDVRGSLFAFLGGGFITLQGVANSRISQDIGTWQAATLTQFTGFVAALLILIFMRDGSLQGFKQVKPLYLTGGAFGAVVIFSNVTAIHQIGVTLTIAVLLIAQLGLTFIIDCTGWFGVAKQKMGLSQFIGIAMMIAGVVILKF